MPLSSYYKKYAEDPNLNPNLLARAEEPAPIYPEAPPMPDGGGMEAPEQEAAPIDVAPQPPNMTDYLRNHFNKQQKDSLSAMDANRVSAEDLARQTDRADQNKLLSGLFESAAQVGNIGGQAAKSTIGNFADELGKSSENFLKGKQGLYAQADKDFGTSVAGLGDVQKMDIASGRADQEKRKSDPNSQESKAARQFVAQYFKQEVPETVSAAFLEKRIPDLRNMYQAKLSSDERMQSNKDRIAATAEERKAQRAFLAGQKNLDRESRVETAGNKSSKDQRDTEISLSKEWRADPVKSAYEKVSNSARQISKLAAGGTGAADMALITQFAKSLDPDTGVRDAEFANAANTGGLTDKLRNFVSKAESGQKLTQEQRDEFARVSNQMSDLLKEQYDQRRKFHVDRATAYELRPDYIVGKEEPQITKTTPNAGGDGATTANRRVWKPNQVGAK